jgi:predicted phosphodiesterase
MQKKTLCSIGVLCVLVSTIGFAQTTRFVAVGDSRGSDNGINGTILQELAAAIIAEDPALVVFTGDLVSGGTQTELQHWVEVFMDPLAAAGIPVYPIRGNHDSSVPAWNTVFSGAHALPGNGPPGEENLTYSFVHNNALFIGLDQVVLSQRVNQTWLDEELRKSTVPHVFVFGHYPAYAVYHASCLAEYPSARDAFWNSLADAGARVYFTGHDHFFNHASIPPDNGEPIQQYIVGSAGAPLYDWSGSYPDPLVQAVTHFKNYGYLVVDIDGLDVTLTFKQRTGTNLYAATSDVFHYVAPGQSEGEPYITGAGWKEEQSPLRLTVVFPGAVEGVTYAWFKDDAELPDETGDVLEIASLEFGNEGWYWCQVTDPKKAVHETAHVYVSVFPMGSLPAISRIGVFAFAGIAILTGALYVRRAGKRRVQP